MKQSFKFHNLFITVLFLTCNGNYPMAEDSKLENNCSQLGAGQKGFIQLVNDKEPGESLIIYGKIIDRNTRQPVNGATLFLYQTDSTGIYTNAGPDEQARIRGTVNTNENGCFKIKTILPGDYPGQKNSRHLHYVINAKGFEEIKSILFFKGFTTENITGRGALMVLDIQKDKTGIWTGSTDFYMKAVDK